MKIAFFPGCMVDMIYPEIGIAAVNVLERLGCEIEMPEKIVCCGDLGSYRSILLITNKLFNMLIT